MMEKHTPQLTYRVPHFVKAKTDSNQGVFSRRFGGVGNAFSANPSEIHEPAVSGIVLVRSDFPPEVPFASPMQEPRLRPAEVRAASKDGKRRESAPARARKGVFRWRSDVFSRLGRARKEVF